MLSIRFDTRPEARNLENLERTFIIGLNDHARPMTAREIGALYQRLREYEVRVGAPDSTKRLERILWEIEQYKQRLSRDAAIATVSEAPGHEPPQPLGSPAEPPENPVDDPWRRGVEQDEFHASAPRVETADQLRVEIEARRRHLGAFNLSESMARDLDASLSRASGEAERIAILNRWIARLSAAYAMSETIVAGRDAAAEGRAMRLREERPRLTIDPRFK
jgi:hypothetical protein